MRAFFFAFYVVERDYMDQIEKRNCLCDESDRPYKDGECPFPQEIVDEIADAIVKDMIKYNDSETKSS